MRIELIEEAIEAVLATRDFQGDENSAITEAGNDLGIIFSGAEIIAIKRGANIKWGKFQKQCGAKVLSAAQRNKAYRDLEEDCLEMA